jgi:small-conductance mechanosensitive channel
MNGTFKLVGFVIFLIAATLFIGFNHKIFELSLGQERSKSYRWLFLVIVLVPFLLIIFAFSYLFGTLFPPTL